MELGGIVFSSLGLLVFLGALVQTVRPSWMSPKTSDSLSAIVVALVGIGVSIWMLRLFLVSLNREGFANAQAVDRWKSLASTYKLQEVCTQFAEVYDRILTVEKGAPPGEVLTDAQAREKTDTRFADKMTVPLLPCGKVQEALRASSDQALLMALLELPETLFVQSYETALACRDMVVENYNQVTQSQTRTVEAFEDAPLCTEAEVDERKRELQKQKALRCRMPSELSQEEADRKIDTYLNRMESAWSGYAKANPIKDPLSKILEDIQYYKVELKKKQDAAVALSNKYDTTK